VFNRIIPTIILILLIATLVEICAVSLQAARASTTSVANGDSQVLETQSSPGP